ncbi:MAG: protein-export chaperone SecB [Clostridia bacterium]|nr:protein-export chaperone SecB [Clostridia bacterium]
MKYTLKAINAEELSFKINNVRIENGGRIELNPVFGRQLRKANNDPKMNFICLSVKIEGTESDPKPFNVNVSIVGIFEAEYETKEEEKQFLVQGTSIMYPYLRSAVTNLTSNTGMPPINLPVISGPIFPEDREVYGISDAPAPGNPNLN